ncbi:hypothetical protein HYV79_05040 [Candidatus Woesearchaeota archaeon]|nr:hypothetical protein [Candidatus Woesearchaeota archaeon]
MISNILFQYGGGYFGQSIEYLQYLGFWDVIIPFALIFAIVFAILEKVDIFAGKKNINATIAIAIALLTIIPHVTQVYPPEYDVVSIINAFLPQAALVFVVLVVVMLMLGITTGTGQLAEKLGKSAPFIAVALVLFLLARAWYPLGGPMFTFLDDPQLISFLVAVLVFGLVVFGVIGFGGGSRNPSHP